MNTEERERLITAWIANAQAERGTAEYEQNDWADSRLGDLMRREPEDGGDPQAAWEIVLAINERPMSGKAIALLAAGPLEDFLVYHGDAFIERVEEQARRDPVFNHLLGGVWRNAISDSVWQRVEAARREIW